MAVELEQLHLDIKRLRDERTRIDVRLKELEIALSVLARYEAKSTQAPTIVRRVIKIDTDTKTDRVMAAVVELLHAGKPIHTADLLPLLSDRGIEIGGVNPEQYLSGILSRNKDDYGMQADRRHGWSLKSQKGESPGVSSAGAFNSQHTS